MHHEPINILKHYKPIFSILLWIAWFYQKYHFSFLLPSTWLLSHIREQIRE